MCWLRHLIWKCIFFGLGSHQNKWWAERGIKRDGSVRRDQRVHGEKKTLNCATYIHGRRDVYRKTLTERKLISPSDHLTRSILQNGCMWNLKMPDFGSPLWPNKDRVAPVYNSGNAAEKNLSNFIDFCKHAHPGFPASSTFLSVTFTAGQKINKNTRGALILSSECKP